MDPATHNPVASLQGQDYVRYGAIKVDPTTGTAAVTDAVIEHMNGAEILTRIKLEAAGADWIEIEGPNGVTYRIGPDNLNRLRLNDDGSVRDGILTDTRTGDKFWFQNNQVVRSVEKKELWALNPETGKAELQPLKAIVETSVDAQGNESLTFSREDGQELKITPTRLDFGKNSYLLIDEKGNQTVYYNGLQVVLGDLKLAAVVEIFQAIRSNPDQLPEQTMEAIADAVGRQSGGNEEQQTAKAREAESALLGLPSLFPGASLANTLVELNLVESLEPIVRIVQGMEIKTEYAGGIILHNPGETPYQLNFGEAKGITVSKKNKTPAGKIGPVDTYSFDSVELNVGGATDPAGGSIKVGAGAKTVLPFREGDADDVGLSFEAATDALKDLVGKTNVSVKLKANNQYAFGKGQVTFTIDSEEKEGETELQRDVRTFGILTKPASQPLNYPPPAILNPGELANFMARELTVGSPEFFGLTREAMWNWIHELNERGGRPPSP